MSFQTDVDSTLAAGRELAESIMVDVCTITRPGPGTSVFDDTTGEYADPSRLVVYSGRCRTQVTSVIANSSHPESGERSAVVQNTELQLPIVGTEDVAVKDVVVIDFCYHDQSLTGRYFTVVSRHDKTHGTSRRLRVEEVTG